jgi:hypothetical protein
MGYVKKLKRELERSIREKARDGGKNRRIGERLMRELEEVNKRKKKV